MREDRLVLSTSFWTNWDWAGSLFLGFWWPVQPWLPGCVEWLFSCFPKEAVAAAMFLTLFFREERRGTLCQLLFWVPTIPPALLPETVLLAPLCRSGDCHWLPLVSISCPLSGKRWLCFLTWPLMFPAECRAGVQGVRSVLGWAGKGS